MVFGQLEAGATRKLGERLWPWVVSGLLGVAISISDIRWGSEQGGAAGAGGIQSVAAAPETVDPLAHERHGSPWVHGPASPFAYEPSAEPEWLPYDHALHEAAGRYRIDVELILAIIMAESRFDPRAKSKKGARGLMQLMPVTASAYDVSDAFDPAENIDAGTRYLRGLLDRFGGDLRLALAAYNAGEQAVLRYKGVPPFPETRAYVEKVLQYYRLIKEDRLDFEDPLTLSSVPFPVGSPVMAD